MSKSLTKEDISHIRLTSIFRRLFLKKKLEKRENPSCNEATLKNGFSCDESIISYCILI